MYDKRARFETSRQDSAFFSLSGKSFQSQSSDIPEKPSQDLSHVSSSQVGNTLRMPLSLEALISEKEERAGRQLNKKEKEYLSLQLEQQGILQIPASDRGKQEKGRYEAIRTRLAKIKPIEEFLKLPSKACKSPARRKNISRVKMSTEAREEDKEKKKVYMRKSRQLDGLRLSGEEQMKRLKLGGESGRPLPLPKPAPMETVEEEPAGEGEEVETGEETTPTQVQYCSYNTSYRLALTLTYII